MRYPYESYQLGLSARMTPAVKWLLISNGGVFLLQQLPFIGLNAIFGLRPTQVIDNFMIWQFGTYLFLHGGPLHIIFNMFILWMFGSEVERTLGTREFLKYYFITGIGAGVIAFLFNIGSEITIIGASGAIYGVLLAFALLFPERVITFLLFFILPVSIKAKHLVIIITLFSVYSALTNLFGPSDGVAHFAHLGGLVIGYFYFKADWRIESTVRRFFKKSKPTPGSNMKVHRSEQSPSFEKQVDEILDKINEIGYDKLSQAEKNILKRASDNLSKKSDSE